MNEILLSSIKLTDLELIIKKSVESALRTHKDRNGEVSQSKEEFLTVKEAASFLNLSVPTIYSKVNRGELPVMKKGKRLYFSSTELLEYLKSGRVKSNSELEAEADDYINNSKKRRL